MKTVGLFVIATILVLGSDGQPALNDYGGYYPRQFSPRIFVPKPYEASEQTSGTAASHADVFAAEFVKALERVKSGSFITSPLSVSTILGMLSFGAAGGTRASLERALDFVPDEFNKGVIQNFMDSLQNDYQSVEFVMANKIYLPFALDRYLTDNFADAVVQAYRSEVESLDFMMADSAAREINYWCSLQTRGRIQDVIDPSTLSPDTVLVLVNAIYFKGTWEHTFEPMLTKDGDFHVNGKDPIPKPMMRQTNYFKVLDIPELDARRIEIPYETNGTSKRVSMFLYVPNKVDGLAKLESNFDHRMLDHTRESGEMERVFLVLPKFEIETTIELEEPLSGMGLGTIFDEPNFSRISRFSLGLRISRAVQKAFLKVDEYGSEAAAVTSFEMENRFGGSDPIDFIVDRPFLGFIGPAEGEFVNFFSFRYTGDD